MAWSTWRGVLGGSLAMLLLVAPAMLARAETSPPVTQPSVAKPAPKQTTTATKAKPKVVKTAAKHEPAHPAKKLSATKPKPSVKHLAEAKKKPEPAKKIEVAKKAEPTKAEPAKVAAAAPPSYTITSTHDGVTTTTTRIVPLPAPPAIIAATAHPSTPTPAPAPPVEMKVAAAAPTAQPEAKPPEIKPVEAKPQAAPVPAQVAALPVSLTEPAHPAAPASFAAVAATAMTPLPEKTPTAIAPSAIEPPDPKAAAAFVSNFLNEAFHIAKSDGTSLQRRARLAELFASHMDVKRIAGYTTADELSDTSADIQQRFRTILVSYLVETYYPQLELASDPSVTVDTAPINPLPNGIAVVWTTFTKDGWGSQSVKWHLVNEDGHYRIIDIFSAGASLVQMERDTFQSVMRNGGLNELMAKLDARTKELASAATE
jgi:ABC-type transporter MlaC component